MLLNVKNLRKDYTRGQQIFSAVNNVSFSMTKDDFICIMGKSGSGKTTLLNMIAGLLTPTQGNITINQTNLFELNDQQVSAFRNQHIGYIPQGSSLLPNLTAIDNIRLPFYLTKRANQNPLNEAKSLLEKAKISHLQDTYPAHMSGGEMRRIAILRALICKPQIIIADEPTSDLDEESAAEIMQLLSEIHQQGTALLIVTHDHDVARYSQKVMKMSAGRFID
ncbi:ATP-binding cassette domain-containing protein [Gilliamella sp. Pra-s65]|uniref:ABC transporter ATP-binding protein n=1 Tax=unclassified Gilliamella TaxID=2685620 RepID=UPI00132A3A6B|nr:MULTISPECIES: ABC transporter ATP-binding protein [unclassified Gilliamella]MWN31403.1 ATP-binding cassette domain-containing protein [Gilliamella sp. Pra-s60]MWN89644.1 ATP-binding cassette domain-containing protein [Gilliamella sp. Pra-s65]MWP28989.1 ATP-binding cassette domain-containing protein [Gilliamella sp. Pra-s54]MWP46233.1 ATP-binding cassette domain-containing protein [Gilliamella sp. Pas-s27]MWP72652.1 ATP-binding cassette domain-containing protein [Gilliamella sp. Pra-s52]